MEVGKNYMGCHVVTFFTAAGYWMAVGTIAKLKADFVKHLRGALICSKCLVAALECHIGRNARSFPKAHLNPSIFSLKAQLGSSTSCNGSWNSITITRHTFRHTKTSTVHVCADFPTHTHSTSQCIPSAGTGPFPLWCSLPGTNPLQNRNGKCGILHCEEGYLFWFD